MDIAALHAFLGRDFPQVAPDLVIESLSPAALCLRLKVGPQHLRPGGTISGPAMFGLADVGMYLAVLARIGPVALAVTTNCAIDFLRKPVAGVDLLAEVRLLKLGRTLAFGDALLFSQGSLDPVARASLTYALPPQADVLSARESAAR